MNLPYHHSQNQQKGTVMDTTKRRSLLRTLTSLLIAVLLGLGLSGCSSPTPEETTKRDELYKSEFVKRGFTDPVKLGDSSGFIGAYSD